MSKNWWQQISWKRSFVVIIARCERPQYYIFLAKVVFCSLVIKVVKVYTKDMIFFKNLNINSLWLEYLALPQHLLLVRPLLQQKSWLIGILSDVWSSPERVCLIHRQSVYVSFLIKLIKFLCLYDFPKNWLWKAGLCKKPFQGFLFTDTIHWLSFTISEVQYALCLCNKLDLGDFPADDDKVRHLPPR